MKRDTLQFISDLADNNNREWFAENKSRYESAREDVSALTRDMIQRIGEFDPEVRYLDPKECMFRIYRDVRFSLDKSPYKRHFGTYIAKNGGHRSLYSGYYIHIEPGNCMLSGGIWCPDSAGVKRLRSVIDTEYEELRAIMAKPAFKRYFGTELVSIDPPLKRIPRGYPEDHPAADWLKLKQILVSWHFADGMLFDDKFEDKLADGCKAMMEFSHWCNDAYFG
ncbi:MAG: DUF2461 domain-containing protein [Paludibacteraceae bacterium]|nr:DUF2461 domain-containing protein [Paludibacteraceae bacterium]